MTVPSPPLGRAWQVTHWTKSSPPVSNPSRPRSGSAPSRSGGREPSSCRLGLGGFAIEARNDRIAAISSGVPSASAPSSDGNAWSKAAKLWRSPRQWNGAFPSSPVRVCVVIGPFMGWKSSHSPIGRSRLQTWSKAFISPEGSPRSQASWSMRPSTWQLPQEAWPRPDVRWVS